ncbi:O-methyltransferase [Brenneria uluponensis]|uniref:O-methyltransferase n=1 Tax=Brenneria uluponensis TaxID=3057057 RepID=UPI0028E758B2|nr:O-methyltransferase [Brenneria ulupoensis]
MQQKWQDVDAYLERSLLPKNANLAQTLALNAERGLPPHDVSSLQGQFLMLMVQISGARRVLEIGTLGGFSTQYMARALPPNGSLVTLEKEAVNAQVARENLMRAGLQDQVTIIVGEAAQSLPTLQHQPPFDLIFIDADKQNSLLYLEWAIKLSCVGSVIIMDNVIRGGAIVDVQRDVHAEGICQMLTAVKGLPALTGTALQTVGSKGWDGFALFRVQNR